MIRYLLAILITTLVLTACGEDSKSPVSPDPIDNNEQPKTENLEMMPLEVYNSWKYVRHVDTFSEKWADTYTISITDKLKRNFRGEEIDAYFAEIHIENFRNMENQLLKRLFFHYGDFVYTSAEIFNTELSEADVQEYTLRYACTDDKLDMIGLKFDMSKSSIQFDGEVYESDFYSFDNSEEYLRINCIAGVGMYYYDIQTFSYRLDMTLKSAIIN